MMTKPGARDRGSRRGGGSHRKQQGGRHHPVTAVQAPDLSKQDLGSNAYRYEEHVSSRDDDFNPEVLQLNRRRQRSDADAFDALLNQSLHTALHQHRETSPSAAEATLAVDLNALASNLRSVPLHSRLDIAPGFFAPETIAEFNRDASGCSSQCSGTQARGAQATATPVQLGSSNLRNRAPLSSSPPPLHYASADRNTDTVGNASGPLGVAPKTAERTVPAPSLSTTTVGASSAAMASLAVAGNASGRIAEAMGPAVPSVGVSSNPARGATRPAALVSSNPVLGPMRPAAVQSRGVSSEPSAAVIPGSSRDVVHTGKAPGESSAAFPAGKKAMSSKSTAATPPIPTVAAALTRTKADEQDDELDFLLGL